MNAIQIPIVNKSRNPVPTYATPGSAGMDLRAELAVPLVLQPFQRALVPTGLYIELPAGFEAQVRPRSGLALKQGITCLNTPGTIDSDYRGEIKILLINLSNEEQSIQPGDRVAQLVLARTERAEFVVVPAINDSVRGAGGFGHTGVQ